MADAGELKARATLDNADFISALKELGNQIQQGTDSAAGRFEAMSGMLGKLGEALAGIGIGAAITKVGADALEAAGKVDKLHAAFVTLNGPTEETEAVFEKLSGLEMKSMFDFEDTLGPASKQMMLLGTSAQQTGETMTALVDAAAALKEGPEWINAVSGALANMSSHMVASSKDMKALAQQGIDGYGALATEIGVTVPEAMEMVKKGAVESSTVIDAVTKQMAS